MRLEGSERGRRNAKRLRREMTPPEIGLWLALRNNGEGLRFRKQHSAGNYVLDFYCAPARLAVEVDGEAHERGDRPERDAVRDMASMARRAGAALSGARGAQQPRRWVRHILAVAVERRGTIKADRRPPPPSPSAPPPPGGGG